MESGRPPSTWAASPKLPPSSIVLLNSPSSTTKSIPLPVASKAELLQCRILPRRLITPGASGRASGRLTTSVFRLVSVLLSRSSFTPRQPVLAMTSKPMVSLDLLDPPNHTSLLLTRRRLTPQNSFSILFSTRKPSAPSRPSSRKTSSRGSTLAPPRIRSAVKTPRRSPSTTTFSGPHPHAVFVLAKMTPRSLTSASSMETCLAAMERTPPPSTPCLTPQARTPSSPLLSGTRSSSSCSLRWDKRPSHLKTVTSWPHASSTTPTSTST